MLYNKHNREKFTNTNYILHRSKGDVMLIQFSVANFRSFKELVTFSMVAAKLSSRDPRIDENNTFSVNNQITLLRSAAIYGANASGKSNLVKALTFMKRFVINSSKESQAEEPIDIVPFRLDSESEAQPSHFEVVFLLDDVVYRYGFEVTKEKVESEWLFYSPHGREAKLFVREGGEILPSRDFKKGQSSKLLTRSNALFLSVAAQFNSDTAIKVLGWFKKLGVVSGLDDRGYSNFTANMFLKNSEFKENVLSLIKNSDVGINNVISEKIDINESSFFPKDMPQELIDIVKKQLKKDEELITFRAIHKKNCKNGAFEEIQFDLDDESEGTQKLFLLSGPVIDSLDKGKVLIIDEIEGRLHTLLTRQLISLFNSPETNPNHAQLIFATHDTNLLSNKLLRRDQIWFVEKDEDSASHLYSLSELKVRNDRSYENDYLEGLYGGIPLLGEMRQMVIDISKEEDHEEKL